MHAPEVFLKHAAECDGMAKFTLPGRAWLSDGANVLNEPNVKSLLSAQPDSHEGRCPLRPEINDRRTGAAGGTSKWKRVRRRAICFQPPRIMLGARSSF